MVTKGNRNWMTPLEAGEDVQVSAFTIRRWCEMGLMGSRVGSRWRITPEQLAAFLLSGLPRSR